MNDRIGFMQGRLSALVDGRIQAFPWDAWREEFAIAAGLGFSSMEWTLDEARLFENPLMTATGQKEIRALSASTGVSTPSLTGDCFMQAPFWKASGAERAELEREFLAIADACAAVGISLIVVPLVDNGRLENAEQEDVLVTFLISIAGRLAACGLRVAFESDFAPADLARFAARLDGGVFGVNYDIGNSAAAGFDSSAELDAYGERVIGVHVKDRVLGGTTVPLGTGNADFERAFAALARHGYVGKYILQTARAADGDHAGALRRYGAMTEDLLRRHGA